MEWRSTALAVTLLITAVATPTLGQAPPDQAVTYEIIIDCPQTAGTNCPVLAVDPQDAMGDPALAVNPDDPDNMIIASLHGVGDDARGPNNKSRANIVAASEPFTTFTTENHGGSWIDNPYPAPSQVGADSFGEHPAITIDPYGQVFIGSMYSVIRDDNGTYDHVIAAQKFSSIRDINQNQRGEYNAHYIGTVHPGNRINQMWFVHNALTDNMTMLWTEEVTPSSLPGSAAAPRVGRTLDDVLAPARIPSPAEDVLGAVGVGTPERKEAPRSVIGVVWTESKLQGDYYAQAPEHVIGPCATSTNPVLSEGWLYVGCKVAQDEGPFPYDPEAEAGDIALFRMDPDGGEPQYLGSSPLSGGKPKLGVRSDGRIALMTAGVIQEKDGGTSQRLDAAYGQYNPSSGLIDWTNTKRYGHLLEDIFQQTNYVEVNIQDMIYREYSGVVHMVLKRVIAPTPDQAAAALGPRIHKAIVAIDEKYGVLAEHDLEIGDPVRRAGDPALAGMSEDVFNDIADDFLQLPPGQFEYNGRPLGEQYQREFFAVGDYGIVQFAEVIELTNLRGPGAAPPPPPPPPPAPAPAASASQVAAYAGALTASALMAGSVATAKRKHLVRAGRKKKN